MKQMKPVWFFLGDGGVWSVLERQIFWSGADRCPVVIPGQNMYYWRVTDFSLSVRNSIERAYIANSGKEVSYIHVSTSEHKTLVVIQD
jgi:hypothetical protein